MQGFGDYLFYGWGTPPPDFNIPKWTIMSLDVFRTADAAPIQVIKNLDKSSSFAVFRYDQFPEGFVVANQDTHPLPWGAGSASLN
jgi:hypothetical protein